MSYVISCDLLFFINGSFEFILFSIKPFVLFQFYIIKDITKVFICSQLCFIFNVIGNEMRSWRLFKWMQWSSVCHTGLNFFSSTHFVFLNKNVAIYRNPNLLQLKFLFHSILVISICAIMADAVNITDVIDAPCCSAINRNGESAEFNASGSPIWNCHTGEDILPSPPWNKVTYHYTKQYRYIFGEKT